MAFDISRYTFEPRKNFSGVVMEQGRVQLDSDWNEWLAELSRRIQAGTLDIFGHAAYPATTPAAFQITQAAGPAVMIGCGRMYVDGLLAENHGLSANAQWDAALAELSGAPQPPIQPPPAPSGANTVDFAHQPHLPGATLPTGPGPFVFYLDVWTRPVTFLEDADLIDKAVAVDTTGRLQTVWQVRWMAAPSGATCATPDSAIFPVQPPGLISTNVVPIPSPGPCCLTTGTGYTGVENQCYRVEIHQAGSGSDSASLKGALFKWSRDNASVATGVTAITTGSDTAGNSASVLKVMSLGRDQVLGFSNGNWIEILDDWSELWGIPGIICQIDSVDVSAKTITLTSLVPTGPTTAGVAPPSFPVDSNGLTDPRRHTRIIRWDQSGTVSKWNGAQLQPWCDLSTTGGLIPVPASDTTLVLEDGVTVVFSGGAFNVGDFWSFDARTSDGSVEILVDAPPLGIHHHYAKLSIVNFGTPPGASDCRKLWSCGEQGACGCCVCTVGEGGQFSTIQQAIGSLPSGGGEICVLPGLYPGRVSINGLSGVVIRGCGADTRLTSQSGAPKQGSTESGLAAVVTIGNSQHIELRSLAIEAADGEAGILLDSFPNGKQANADIAVSGLVITASTLPAIAAVDVTQLSIADNRIAMRDVPSAWASLYARGTEMRIERNWIGLQDASNATDWIPVSVIGDLPQFGATPEGSPAANGGIHIAGSSLDVLISENEIEGGCGNGVTLGSFVLLVDGVEDTSILAGLRTTDGSSSNATLQLPPSGAIGSTKGALAAGPALQNIRIASNRIRNMGLCGVGPVGFFDLSATPEVISIANLSIVGNAIAGTVQDTVAPFTLNAAVYGYGAVCIPDVQNLIVRDNTITDFGNMPGAQVCGIYVLLGEQVEISRNQVIETRDWSQAGGTIANLAAVQAGVYVVATPPRVDLSAVGSAWTFSGAGSSAALAAPIFEPGLPALRVENNVVRVALGLAFEASGRGPFAIVGNHLSSGGALAASPATGAMTVLIANLGLPIEFESSGGGYHALYNQAPPQKVAVNPLAASSSGAVLFANNICQLEARASGATGFASVIILSLDHLNFSNNHCWLDGVGSPFGAFVPQTAVMDALLLSLSLQVNSNRFQEPLRSVLVSGVTFGWVNITSINISTSGLIVTGGAVVNAGNL